MEHHYFIPKVTELPKEPVENIQHDDFIETLREKTERDLGEIAIEGDNDGD